MERRRTKLHKSVCCGESGSQGKKEGEESETREEEDEETVLFSVLFVPQTFVSRRHTDTKCQSQMSTNLYATSDRK